jgi:hypothetical protein
MSSKLPSPLSHPAAFEVTQGLQGMNVRLGANLAKSILLFLLAPTNHFILYFVYYFAFA